MRLYSNWYILILFYLARKLVVQVSSDNNFNFDTPGTAGGPGGRDRRLAVKSRKTSKKSSFFLKKIRFTPQKYFFLHISSSYAKILGEKLFRTWEIPRSGSKAEDREKKEKRGEKERLNDGENNGQATHGARKHAWRTQAAWANKWLGFFRIVSHPKT